MSPAGANACDVTPRVWAYCRAARRIRGRHAHQPTRLHRALRELSQQDSVAPPTIEPALTMGSARCEHFAAEVARRLEGPVLRYRQRHALLAKAERLGIGRFEANLVIAAIQHRSAATGTGDAKVIAEAGGSRLGAFALVFTLQALIVWGAWSVFCG